MFSENTKACEVVLTKVVLFKCYDKDVLSVSEFHSFISLLLSVYKRGHSSVCIIPLKVKQLHC